MNMKPDSQERLHTLLPDGDPLLTPLKLGNHSFPGVWRMMMPPGFMKLHVPDEQQATCSHCPKSSYENFRPDYRCCTYYPRVSNFLLGLAMETVQGRRAVDDLLQRGLLLPEGMHGSPRQWLDFTDDVHKDLFGKSQRTLCPMLDPDAKDCRIYAFRNSVCSTFFCFKDHGSTGDFFWDQLQTLVAQLEMRLAQWALQKTGFDLDIYLQSMNELANDLPRCSTDRGWTPAALAKLWGPWQGREKQLLRACAKWIATHRHELWEIAQRQVLREAPLFDEALLRAAISEKTSSETDDDNDDDDGCDDETEDHLGVKTYWQNCLTAHNLLWCYPEGMVTLSPNVKFHANMRQSAEEIFHQSKEFFLEYHFRSPGHSSVFRRAITQTEKRNLELFRDQKLPLPRDSAFLLEMFKSKVICVAPV
jgi:Fe-S-cluster containining protein